MKILITGAAGLLGSHLLEYLIEQGHEVCGLDNYSLGKYEHDKIVKLDLLDKPKVDKLVKDFKPELIFHMAAWAHEGLSQFAPILITENNYNAYLNIVVPAIKYGVRKIVVGSSMSVYGDQTPPFHEGMETQPADIYAIAKVAMERSVKLLSEVHGIDYVIIRPHNVYGPRQNITDPYRNVIGIFMNRIMNGKAPIIYGDGEQTRAFSYIDDVIPYLAKAGLDNDITKEVINVGPTEEYSINHLAKVVLDSYDSTLKPIYFADRPLEVRHAYCTNDKAIELLGYKTTTSLEDGVKKMAEWAREQGPDDFKYLDSLELENEHTPLTWKNKLM